LWFGNFSDCGIETGGSSCTGVDIDADAVLAAEENITLNGVNPRMQLALGSLDEIIAGNFSLRQAPLVLANILAPILIRLF